MLSITERNYRKQLMTKEFYDRIKPIYISDPCRYSGEVYTEDFDTQCYMSHIAARITSDQRFDAECKKNSLKRDERILNEIQARLKRNALICEYVTDAINDLSSASETLEKSLDKLNNLLND